LPELPSEFLQRRAEQRWNGELEKAKVERMNLGEEAVCPVCQEEMK
jgi:hypothetical protein